MHRRSRKKDAMSGKNQSGVPRGAEVAAGEGGGERDGELSPLLLRSWEARPRPKEGDAEGRREEEELLSPALDEEGKEASASFALENN